MTAITYTETRTKAGKKAGIVARLGWFEATGTTSAAATAALLDAITRHPYPRIPVVLQYRTTTGMVFQHGQGYGYQILPHDQPTNSRACVCLAAVDETRADVERALRVHLAQWHMDLEHGDMAADILFPDQRAAHQAYCHAIHTPAALQQGDARTQAGHSTPITPRKGHA